MYVNIYIYKYICIYIQIYIYTNIYIYIYGIFEGKSNNPHISNADVHKSKRIIFGIGKGHHTRQARRVNLQKLERSPETDWLVVWPPL